MIFVEYRLFCPLKTGNAGGQDLSLSFLEIEKKKRRKEEEEESREDWMNEK